jgi:hypothetical protein
LETSRQGFSFVFFTGFPADATHMQAAASHDVDPDVPIVNGTANYGDIENKHITNIEDSSAPTEASVSGGSDTEASRADGSRQGKDDEKGHNRAGSSIKKPATFKAVSVNKKFLASKVTTPGATAKAGDISRPSSSTPPPGASTPSSSKPRLIAKTAPGVGSRLSSLVNGGKPASAPDASAVWNKNRRRWHLFNLTTHFVLTYLSRSRSGCRPKETHR